MHAYVCQLWRATEYSVLPAEAAVRLSMKASACRVEMLVDCGARMSAVDHEGNTCLHVACAVVRMILFACLHVVAKTFTFLYRCSFHKH